MHEPSAPPQAADRNLAPVAALIAEPARAAMLSALAGGTALPAADLARSAGVHPATASGHLRRLVDGGLVRVREQGRHRYHELAGPEVATALEGLAQMAPPSPPRSLRSHRAAWALHEARTCYDHLAGRRGVQLRDRLLEGDALQQVDDRDHGLGEHGRRLLDELGIDTSRLDVTRRVFARCCVDWTHRRPHLAGAVPAAITHAFLQRGWLRRLEGRALRVAPDYDARLDQWLGPEIHHGATVL